MADHQAPSTGLPSAKRLLFAGAASALPILLLFLVEIGLSAAGVAADRRTVFIPVDEAGQYIALNPAYVERYFTDFRPGVPFTPFAREKADSTFRVVALGGSTTAGFPYRFYNGFPGRLEVQLQAAVFPRQVEVINLGMSAVTSFTVLDLGRAVLRHDPDVLVVYAGHNEYYGAMGVATTESRLANIPWLKRLIVRLRKTVLFTLAESAFVPERGAQPTDRTLMARVVRESNIPMDGDLYAAGLTQYQANMSRLLEAASDAGVPVVMGTLVDNLAGQPPLSASPEADSLFARAGRLAASGDTPGARRLFVQARDADGLRFRAPSPVNDWIRNRTRARVLDFEALFTAASDGGIPGNDLFTDHLHPNARGYALMASAFAEAVASEPVLSLATDASLDSLDAAHSRLLLDRLLGDYPFVRDAAPEAVEARNRARTEAAIRGGGIDSLAASVISGRIPFVSAQADATSLLLAAGDSLAALRSARALAAWQPLNRDLLLRWIRTGVSNPDLDSETLRLAVLAAGRWPDGFTLGALGAVLLRQGRLDESRMVLSRAEAAAPDDPSVLFNTARLLILSGDTLSARQYFERYRAASESN